MKTRYTTMHGDMWDLVAHSQLGDSAHTGKLMNLNREYLGFYTFPAGVVLDLPEIEPCAPAGLPPWKGTRP